MFYDNYDESKWYLKFLIIMIILFLICFIFLFNNCILDNYGQEDLFFMKLLGNNIQKESDNNNNEIDNNKNNSIDIIENGNMNDFDNSKISYDILVDYNNKINVDFLDIVNSNLNFKRKVYPGSNGVFYLNIRANKDIYFYIDIFDLTIRPSNLKFNYPKDGFVKKGNITKVRINWKWDYFIDSKNDYIDTYDGMNIKDFSFMIVVNEV